MPDYVTTAQVSATIPKWPQDRWPSGLDVDLEISGIEGQLNSALAGRGLTTPFVSDGTDAQDAFADFLTMIVRNGVAWRIVREMFPQQVSAGADAPWHDYMAVWKGGLASVKDGSALPRSVLEDEEKVLGSTVNTKFPSGSVRDSLGSENKPHFTRRKASEY